MLYFSRNFISRIKHLSIPVRHRSIIDSCRPCPPCQCPKKEKSKMIVAKTCKKCSFWQQEEDNCKGKPWKLRSQGEPLRAKYHVCSSHKFSKCDKKTLAKASCDDVKVNVCYDIPECPKPTWECHK